MSSYVRVLARVEAEEGEERLGTAASPGSSASSVPSARRLRPVRSTDSGELEGIAALLDNIRAHAKGGSMRTVVLTGVCSGEPIRLVTAGLAAHARQRGMNVVLADLVPAPGPMRLVERSGNESMRLDDLAPDVDLMVIQAPPLTESVEGALFASACDGLVIVAERAVTERSALQAAAERARTAGCHILGVVMFGEKEEMPGWLRRLVGNATGPQP
jgi:Mrp family chromosome partitioning ATPase